MDGVRRAKVQLEINADRDFKSTKKSFYNSVISKIGLSRLRVQGSSLLSGAKDILSGQGLGQAKTLRVFLDSVITSKIHLVSQAQNLQTEMQAYAVCNFCTVK